MNDLADFPTIQAEPMPVATKTAAPEPGTLKATALASFVAIRSHAAKLAEKYRAVAYDVTTPKGMAAAKDARLELLGFPAVKVHNAKLYQETDRPAIIAKLVNHLLGL